MTNHICDQLCNIGPYQHYFDSPTTIIFTKKMVENVKLRQIIAKIYSTKKLLWGQSDIGLHGNTFVGVTSKSTNLAKIMFPGDMTIPIKFNKLERGTF